MNEVVTRFAPSPTGRLHLGHAYSALLAYGFARERKGRFLLRIEDIDPSRSRREHVDAIIEDLRWLGLSFDGEILYQSKRLPFYAEVLDRLKALSLAYPCFCTRASIAAEVAASASAPHGPDGPLYPGTCRILSAAERRARIASEPHAWRLDVLKAAALAGPLRWKNADCDIEATPELFGDVVLARKDAPVSYHLAATADDAAQGVTDIVRGGDLFASTHVHRLLQQLLGLPTPKYHHHPLLLGADGKRLAKRNDAPALSELRLSGVNPHKLAADLLTGALPAGYSVEAP